MLDKVQKLGSAGAVIAAAACPICFPKLALVGAFFGLGALSRYEPFFFYGAQVMVLLILAANLLTWRRHGNRRLPALVVSSAALFFASLYLVPSEYLTYASFAGLGAAGVWSVFASRGCATCGSPPDEEATPDAPGPTPCRTAADRSTA